MVSVWTNCVTMRRMLIFFKKKTHLKAQELIFLRGKLMTVYN
uniref:Alternative protein SPTLC1 n=1 Tax=Homo sapiens TaxID=9606 RepID=L8E7V1_HUMAN|nr:alternative protein SPTLC1 [Homo sapiens]